VSDVSRWILGLFGAIALIAEGTQKLFQFQRSGLAAMKTCNNLERTLNGYMTAIEPYEGPIDKAFPIFVKKIEAIRSATDDEFLKAWQESTPHSRPELQREVTFT
jgi:hypothetical protein